MLYGMNTNNKTLLSISALVVIAIIVIIVYASANRNTAAPAAPAVSGAASTTQSATSVPAKASSSAAAKPATSVTTQAPAQQGSDSLAQYKSGISGLVSYNSRGYQTTVVVFRASDLTHAYAISQTDENGIYHFPLPPGSYVVGAGVNNSPQCDHPQVTIGQDSLVTANIACK